MRQAWWKRILSYIFEIHIESAPSEINPHLYVSLSRGRYQLCTANAVYSYGDLYDNFRKAFEQIDLDRIKGKDVLLLGFGLGSIPYMLEEKFQRHFRYTAVELDDSVIELASKYVIPQLEATVEMVQADAYAYMLQNERKFDLIAMDVFLDDVVPAPFETLEYLEVLKNALKQEGLLIYNRLALTTRDEKRTNTFYQEQFKQQFPEGEYLDVDGNWMLLSRSDYRR